MKQKINILLATTLSLFMYSCGIDNYDAPASGIQGKVAYQGAPIGVRGSGEKVQLQLYQDGFALRTPIPVYVTQDGSFKATLFDGEYKLVSRDNNGPWVNSRDTVLVTVKGNTICEYPVSPYYLIRDESFSLTGDILKASCKIQQITAGKNITSVVLIVNKTIFVDDVSSVAKVSISNPSDLNNITLEMNLSARSEPFLYARIGVQISGVNDYLFSTIEKIR